MHARKACLPHLAPALAAALAIHAVPVPAATFVVTRFDDPVPGACAVGDCSLREAAIAANAAAGADRIELAEGTYLLQIAPGANDPASGDIDLTTTTGVTVVGRGRFLTLIDANGIDRVFDVVAASFEDLAITGGVVSGPGGGIRATGALSLTLTKVRVFDNEASSAFGGGIAALSAGSVYISSSQIESNRANNAAAVFCANTTTCGLAFSTVRANQAVFQSAVTSQSGGSITVEASAIVGNSAGTFPAGLLKFGTGSVDINRSTVSGNVAGGAGAGAIGFSDGLFSMNNSTVSGNDSAGTDGLVLTNATTNFVDNVFDDPCQRSGGSTGLSSGNVESGGNTCGLNPSTDRVNVPAASLALPAPGDHGGWSPTQPPGAQSVLRRSTSSGSPLCTISDQRFSPRQARDCDIGAVNILPCSEPAAPIAIPDNSAPGIEDELVVADPDAIQIMQLYIEIAHANVGDLTVELEHVDTGTRRTVLRRPFLDGTSGACSGDNVGIHLNDFQLPADFGCKRGAEAFDDEEYGSTETLDAFNGELLEGTWRLHVRDSAAQNTGALTEWCLRPVRILGEVFANGFESP